MPGCRKCVARNVPALLRGENCTATKPLRLQYGDNLVQVDNVEPKHQGFVIALVWLRAQQLGHRNSRLALHVAAECGAGVRVDEPGDAAPRRTSGHRP